MTEQDFSPIDISGLLEAAPVGDKPSDCSISNVESPEEAAAVGDQAPQEHSYGPDPVTGLVELAPRSSSPKGDWTELTEKSDSGDAANGESTNRTSESERSEAESSTVAFYSAKPYSARSMYDLKREQPHHRLFCILFAQGFTGVEIAEQTGFDAWTINNVKKQDWAQKLIAELQQSQGERAIKSILCGAAAEVARKMCETALGKTEAAPAVQLNAQKEVLNRLFGVAPQHIKHEQVSPEDLSTEELRKLIKQN